MKIVTRPMTIAEFWRKKGVKKVWFFIDEWYGSVMYFEKKDGLVDMQDFRYIDRFRGVIDAVHFYDDGSNKRRNAVVGFKRLGRKWRLIGAQTTTVIYSGYDAGEYGWVDQDRDIEDETPAFDAEAAIRAFREAIQLPD